MPLTIITKCSILDVATVLEPPLIVVALQLSTRFPWSSFFRKGVDFLAVWSIPTLSLPGYSLKG